MDALDKAIIDYLEGRGADVDLVRRMYDKDEGHQLIIPVLRMTIPALKSTGVQLAAVMKKSEELSATLGPEEAGRRNFQAEMDAGRPVDPIFVRTQQLIGTVAFASPQQVGRQIGLVINGPDQSWCVLAAVHSATKGIPREEVIGALLDLYVQENPPLIRVAVATGLVGFLDWLLDMHREVAQKATREVLEFTHGAIYVGFPALVHRVKNEYQLSKDLDRLSQDVLIAKLGIYYFVLHNEVG